MNFIELIEKIKGKDIKTNINKIDEENGFASIKNFCFKYKYILLYRLPQIPLLQLVKINPI